VTSAVNMILRFMALVSYLAPAFYADAGQLQRE